MHFNNRREINAFMKPFSATPYVNIYRIDEGVKSWQSVAIRALIIYVYYGADKICTDIQPPISELPYMLNRRSHIRITNHRQKYELKLTEMETRRLHNGNDNCPTVSWRRMNKDMYLESIPGD